MGPWVQQSQVMVRGQTDFSPFMWEPKPKEDWRAGEDKDEDIEDEDGAADADEWSDDGEESERQPEPKNLDGSRDNDQVRNVMRRENSKRIDVGIGVNDWRHTYPAIQQEFTQDRSVREALDSI